VGPKGPSGEDLRWVRGSGEDLRWVRGQAAAAQGRIAGAQSVHPGEERIPMMGWYGWNHMSGWGWFAMTTSTVLLLALVVGGIVLLARIGQQPSQRFSSLPPRSAEELLGERLARGEIDEEEYRRRLATLTRSGHTAPLP
jgi:putative membrane protein